MVKLGQKNLVKIGQNLVNLEGLGDVVSAGFEKVKKVKRDGRGIKWEGWMGSVLEVEVGGFGRFEGVGSVWIRVVKRLGWVGWKGLSWFGTVLGKVDWVGCWFISLVQQGDKNSSRVVFKLDWVEKK